MNQIPIEVILKYYAELAIRVRFLEEQLNGAQKIIAEKDKKIKELEGPKQAEK